MIPMLSSIVVSSSNVMITLRLQGCTLGNNTSAYRHVKRNFIYSHTFVKCNLTKLLQNYNNFSSSELQKGCLYYVKAALSHGDWSLNDDRRGWFTGIGDSLRLLPVDFCVQHHY